jgi:hypothetical protein
MSDLLRKIRSHLTAAVVLSAALGLGVVAATPAPVKADSCYPCYRYVYRLVGYRCEAYTAYDHCGRPYTAYRHVPVYRWVRVAY